ncbi:MAG: post-PEP-CTERM-1 domain-containing protein [Lysobacteraceae bacterium]
MKVSKTSLFLAAGLCFAPGAQAQAPAPASAPANARHDAGIRVGIDRATGRLRQVTPEEAAALSRADAGKRTQPGIARSAAPADAAAAARTVRKSADGSVSVRVPKSAMTQLRGRIGPDGRIVLSEDGHDAPAAQRAPEAME